MQREIGAGTQEQSSGSYADCQGIGKLKGR